MKVAIIGCGRVGSTTAYTMMLSGVPSEIVLYDRNLDRALGEKLDIEHAVPILDYVNFIATDDLKDIVGSDLIVVSAGAAQLKGQSRLDLIASNKEVIAELMPRIVEIAPKAIVIMITNPVDVLTQYAYSLAPEMKGRIFGSGTLLDTLRFRYYLSQEIKINPRSIHAYILGEHGDHSFPVYENTMIGGKRLMDFGDIDEEVITFCYQRTRGAAGEVIALKGATYYAIAVVVTKLMEAIASDAKTVFPLSVPLHNYYGISGVALSVPCILGGNGVERVLEVEFSKKEKEQMKKAAEEMRKYN